jgi:hypothetical protein
VWVMSASPRCVAYITCVVLVSVAVSAQQKPQPQLRGFSVVLVQGDQQEGSSSDLPPAARAAIGDIKDFLPFKSYRLLDSSWTLGSNAAQEYSSRLRGGGQDYQVRIGSKVDDASSRVEVKFTLRDAGPDQQQLWPFGSAHVTGQQAAATVESRVKEEANLVSLEAELSALLRRFNPTHPDVQQQRARIAESRRRVEQLRQQVQANEGTTGSWYAASLAPLIDTSFTMRLGETVVVGTSRVGGDKALIALLTAVTGSGK